MANPRSRTFCQGPDSEKSAISTVKSNTSHVLRTSKAHPLQGFMLTCAARLPFPGTVKRCMHRPCQGERLQDCFCQSMSLSENVSERLSESASESAFKSDETMARLS